MAIARRQLARAVVSANCQPTDQVGRAVHITGDRVGDLYQVTTVDIEDDATIPSLGIIISKSSSTTCLVQLTGLVEGLLTGLTPDGVIFIAPDGSLTQTKPTANVAPGFVWVQHMGQAMASDVFILNPQTPRKLKP